MSWSRMKRSASAVWLAAVIAATAALGAAACGDEQVGKTTQGSIEGDLDLAIELPPLLGADSAALVAAEDLDVGNNAQITGVQGALTSVVALGPPGALVRSDAVLGHLYSNGPAILGDRSRVHGSIFANGSVTPGHDSHVDGIMVTDFDFSPLKRHEWRVTIPVESNGNVMIEPDQHEALGQPFQGSGDVGPSDLYRTV